MSEPLKKWRDRSGARIAAHGSAALAAALLFVGTPAYAGYVTDTLAGAGPDHFAILGLGGTNTGVVTDVVFTGPGQTVGNVGVASGGGYNSSSSTPPGTQGNLYLGNTATFTQSGGTQVSGSIFTNQDGYLGTSNSANFWGSANQAAALSGSTGVVRDALSAAWTFAHLAANQTIAGNLTSAMTLTAGALGPNNTWVVNITGNLNLGNGEWLTLAGNAGTQFILNIAGTVTIGGGNGEGIKLSGGLNPWDVVVNVTSTSSGDNVTTNGGGNAAVINGILLDVAGGINMSPGLVNGEIIGGGKEIRLVSGAEVQGSGGGNQVVPEPGTLALMGLGGIGMAFAGWRKRRAGATAA